MTVRIRPTRIAVGAFVIGAAVAFPATAAAEPPPPPVPLPADPAVPPPADPAAAPLPPDPAAPAPPAGPNVPVLGMPLSNGLGVLAQRDQPGVPGALGAPSVNGLDAASVLGQAPVPMAPNGTPGTPPNFNVFNNAYGLPQYEVPSAPGGKQFDVAPGQENSDVSKREWFGRFIDMQRDHRTYGGLGQRPEAELGQPLPGTAPPPGTVISPGLVEYLPPAPDDGAPPPPPGLILPPPPPPPGG